ncbi:MAG: filamentous hemagglutinin N-terminal domain-containing protein [Methylacidiphilales bacterium]|nr:filamentous hemagglutinin N-terminal domain-containing protein [Candidatus Methylacidiphilales bacterium]
MGLRIFVICGFLIGSSPLVVASPQFESLISGSAQVSQSGSETTVIQQSAFVELQWNSFNIGIGERVVFNQPSTSSIVINNIIDSNPSQVLGNISATGRVVLLNPQGFYFGESSSVSAHTFIVATSSLEKVNYDLTSNRLTSVSATGNIDFRGLIIANTVHMIAKTIAINDSASITAGKAIRLQASQQIVVHGKIKADDLSSVIDIFSGGDVLGSAELSAAGIELQSQGVLSYSGTLEATDTIAIVGNIIQLDSSVELSAQFVDVKALHGYLLLSGTVSSYYQNYSAQSSLNLLSAQLMSHGGDIHIGSASDFPKNIVIDARSNITASTNQLNRSGGSVVLFAQKSIELYGKIAANSTMGKGGVIELSSYDSLYYAPQAQIQVIGALGNGTILIDPTNVYIVDRYAQSFELFKNIITAQIIPINQINTNIGSAIALTEKYLLIGASLENKVVGGVTTLGAGGAYLYSIDDGSWTNLSSTPGAPQLNAGDSFGSAVALSDQYALIGAPNYDITVAGGSSLVDSGNAFLYNLTTFAWTNLSLTPSAPQINAGDSFGSAVALSDQYALIGAPKYDVVVNGSARSNSGNAFLYNLTTFAWTNLSSTSGVPQLNAGDSFGSAVALSDQYALIGAPNYDITVAGGSSLVDSGNAFLYNLTTFAWTNLSSTSGVPQLNAGDSFGSAVALSDQYALIGAPKYDVVVNGSARSNSGNAFLYNLTTFAWTNLSLTPSAPQINAGDSFGSAVALSDQYALIGAPNYDITVAGGSSLVDSGNAFLFDVSDNVLSSLLHTLNAPPVVAGSKFGTVVGIFNNTIAINAPTIGIGAVYLQKNSSDAWVNILGVFNAPIVQSTSYIGNSVALNNSYALLGAYYYQQNLEVGSGNAFLYHLASGTWTNLLSLANAPIQANSNFGYSVALNETHALIGAPLYSPTVASVRLESTGDAFLYRISDGVWTDLAKANGAPSLQTSDNFGYSVSLNETYALIGAYSDSYNSITDSGNAYLYNLTNGQWRNLLASSGAPTILSLSNFGNAVSLSSMYALIGAYGRGSGNAYLYRLSDGAWQTVLSMPGAPVVQENASFGWSVAATNSHILIGASLDTVTQQSNQINSSGNAYLCAIVSFNQLTCSSLFSNNTAPVALADALIGESVALSATHALIGASAYDFQSLNASGNVFVYEIATSTWTDLLSTTGAPSPHLGMNFGNSVAITGDNVLIGAKGYSSLGNSKSGTVFIYSLAQSQWKNLLQSLSTPLIQANASIGSSVALSATYALVGASNYNQYLNLTSGTVFLYNLSHGTWLNLLSTPDAPSLQAGAMFGASVALSDEYALIGSPQYDLSNNGTMYTDSGNAYLYELSDGTWTNLLSSANAPVQAGAMFGASVALSDEYALIGSPQYDMSNNGTVSTDSGNAHLFELSDGTWTNLLSRANAPVQAGARFGTSVALSDEYALIGSPQYDMSNNGTVSTDSGNAHLFELSDGTWTNLLSRANAPVQAGARFGTSVALSDEYALIGSPQYDMSNNGTVSTDSGNAHLFELSDGTWTNLLSRANAPVQAGAQFGASVALSDEYALIGSPQYDMSNNGTMYTDSGNAYLFHLSTFGITDIYSVFEQTPSAGATVGKSVALYGLMALLGAPSFAQLVYGISYSNSGAVFLLNFANNKLFTQDDIYFWSKNNLTRMLSNANLTIQADADIVFFTPYENNSTSYQLTLNATNAIRFKHNNVLLPFGSFTIRGEKIVGVSSIIAAHLSIELPSLTEIYPLLIAENNPAITGFQRGSLNLVQRNGDFNVSSTTQFSQANITIEVRGANASINLSLYNVTAAMVTLRTQSGSITTTSGTITASTIVLQANSIGSNQSPIIIERNEGEWNESNIVISSVSSGSIFLKSSGMGLFNASIPVGVSGTVSLEQTSGVANISKNILLPNAMVLLTARDSITITSSLSARYLRINSTSASITTSKVSNLLSSNSIVLLAPQGNIASMTNHLSITQLNNLDFSLIIAHAQSVYLNVDSGSIRAMLLALPLEPNPNTHNQSYLQFSDAVDITTVQDIYVTNDISSCIASRNSVNGCTFTDSVFSLINKSEITNNSNIVLTRGTIELIATTGDIGSLEHPIIISTGEGELENFSRITLQATNGSIYIKRSERVIDILTPVGANSTLISYSEQGTLTLIQESEIQSIASLNNENLRLSLIGQGAIIISHDLNLKSFNAVGSSVVTNNATIYANTIKITASSGSVGTATSPISISSITGDFSLLTLSLKAPLGSVFVRSSTNVIPFIIGDNPSILFASTQTFLFQRSSGAITISAPLRFPHATLIFTATSVDGAINFISSSVTAFSITLTTSGQVYFDQAQIYASNNISVTSDTILSRQSPDSSFYNVRAPSLTLQARLGKIGSVSDKIVISSGVNESPDFSNLSVTVPQGSSIYLIRLPGLASASSAMQYITRGTGSYKLVRVFFYQPSSPQKILLSNIPVSKPQYEGFISMLLYQLLGLDCSSPSLLSKASIKVLCQLSL